MRKINKDETMRRMELAAIQAMESDEKATPICELDDHDIIMVFGSMMMISSAFGCKQQMRDERWRMCCEAVGIDYDQTMQQIEEDIRCEADQPATPAAIQEVDQTSTGGLRITSMEGDWCTFKMRSDYGVDVALKDCFRANGNADVESLCCEIRAACRMMLGDAYDDA